MSAAFDIRQFPESNRIALVSLARSPKVIGIDRTTAVSRYFLEFYVFYRMI